MKTYKFEEMRFTYGSTCGEMLNSISNNEKGAIIKFKKCKFNQIAFTLFEDSAIKLYFDDCTFDDSSITFADDNKCTVVFKNCKFESITNKMLGWRFPLRITGKVGPKSILKFENCTGLTKDYFTSNPYVDGEEGDCGLRVTNPKCTLSYMGLYQTFKNRVLSKSKEEIVYKKIDVFRFGLKGWKYVGSAIATLVIPKGVLRYGNKHGKCRCQYAVVRDITSLPNCKDNGRPDKCIYKSMYSNSFEYKVGETITPDVFDLMPGECSYGIHYFYDINDAMSY